MFKHALFILFCYLCVFVQAQNDQWLTHYDSAQKMAKEQNKYILLYFQQSNDCGWCVRLNEEVVYQSVFQQLAAVNFVLCTIDFSQKNQSQQQKNGRKLQQKYKTTKFPTILLLDQQGRAFCHTGYRHGGVSAYISFLERVVAAKRSYTQIITTYNDQDGFLLWQQVEKLWKNCPNDAYILRASLAELLFKTDIDNKSGRRFKAAFIASRFSSGDKDLYINYLREGLSKDKDRYYEKLLDHYYRDRGRRLAVLYSRVYFDKQQSYRNKMIYEARFLLTEMTQLLVPFENREVYFNIVMVKALCYKCLEQNDKFWKIWNQLNKMASESDKLEKWKQFFRIK